MSASKVILGCDPELALIDTATNQTIPANTIISRGGGMSRVGVDGSGIPAEIRPGVSESPIGLVAKCLDALKEMKEVLGRRYASGALKVKAGSFAAPRTPLGGHVHLAGDSLLSNKVVYWADNLALAWWFGIDSEHERRMRLLNGYGRIGDIRSQNHGLEYRAMGSWLNHPATALAAISLVKVAAVQQDFPTSPGVATGASIRTYERAEFSGEEPWIKDWPAWFEKLNPVVPEDCHPGVELAIELWKDGRQDMNQDTFVAWEI